MPNTTSPNPSAAAPKSRKPRTPKTGPTREAIALRAYHIFLERGGASGDPLQDWLRAESELSAPRKKSRGKSKVVPFAA